MTDESVMIAVFLEVGAKRVFAGALDWPGWCRSGRDEREALQALLDYAPRYARVMAGLEPAFRLPASLEDLRIVERLEGNTGTDFGAPGMTPAQDRDAMGPGELARGQAIMRACWRALDEAARNAAGVELKRGPRGGGRDLERILAHAREADLAYHSVLGGDNKTLRIEAVEETRKAILETLARSARGEIPERGPRGGKRWPPRFFVRYAAWHTLDHAWEIETRAGV